MSTFYIFITALIILCSSLLYFVDFIAHFNVEIAGLKTVVVAAAVVPPLSHVCTRIQPFCEHCEHHFNAHTLFYLRIAFYFQLFYIVDVFTLLSPDMQGLVVWTFCCCFSKSPFPGFLCLLVTFFLGAVFNQLHDSVSFFNFILFHRTFPQQQLMNVLFIICPMIKCAIQPTCDHKLCL